MPKRRREAMESDDEMDGEAAAGHADEDGGIDEGEAGGSGLPAEDLLKKVPESTKDYMKTTAVCLDHTIRPSDRLNYMKERDSVQQQTAYDLVRCALIHGMAQSVPVRDADMRSQTSVQNYKSTFRGAKSIAQYIMRECTGLDLAASVRPISFEDADRQMHTQSFDVRADFKSMHLVNPLAQKSAALRDRLEGIRAANTPFYSAQRGLETLVLSVILGSKGQGLSEEQLADALPKFDPGLEDDAYCQRQFGRTWREHLTGSMRVTRLVDRCREQYADEAGVNRQVDVFRLGSRGRAEIGPETILELAARVSQDGTPAPRDAMQAWMRLEALERDMEEEEDDEEEEEEEEPAGRRRGGRRAASSSKGKSKGKGKKSSSSASSSAEVGSKRKRR